MMVALHMESVLTQLSEHSIWRPESDECQTGISHATLRVMLGREYHRS